MENNNVECPICEELTGKFVKDVENGRSIESEYYCSKCGVTFARVRTYGWEVDIDNN